MGSPVFWACLGLGMPSWPSGPQKPQGASHCDPTPQPESQPSAQPRPRSGGQSRSWAEELRSASGGSAWVSALPTRVPRRSKVKTPTRCPESRPGRVSGAPGEQEAAQMRELPHHCWKLAGSKALQRPSLLARTVKRPSAMRETQAPSLGREDPLQRKRQPTLELSPGRSHGWRSLVGYSPWGRKESDGTKSYRQQRVVAIIIIIFNWK